MLSYDFDIFYIDSPEVASEIGLVTRKKIQGQQRQNQVVALFRDQETVDALSSAPPIVRLFLEEVGFGRKAVKTMDRRSEPPTLDPVMRHTLIEQLSAAASNRAMKKALIRASRECTFNIYDLLTAVIGKDMLSVGTPEIKVTPRTPSQIRSERERRRARPV